MPLFLLPALGLAASEMVIVGVGSAAAAVGAKYAWDNYSAQEEEKAEKKSRKAAKKLEAKIAERVAVTFRERLPELVHAAQVQLAARQVYQQQGAVPVAPNVPVQAQAAK